MGFGGSGVYSVRAHSSGEEEDVAVGDFVKGAARRLKPVGFLLG